MRISRSKVTTRIRTSRRRWQCEITELLSGGASAQNSKFAHPCTSRSTFGIKGTLADPSMITFGSWRLQKMAIALVAAVAENGVIGENGRLPWRLKSDMQRFRALTWGRPVVVGRKTYLSFSRQPLPGRTNIVVSRDPDFAVA